MVIVLASRRVSPTHACASCEEQIQDFLSQESLWRDSNTAWQTGDVQYCLKASGKKDYGTTLDVSHQDPRNFWRTPLSLPHVFTPGRVTENVDLMFTNQGRSNYSLTKSYNQGWSTINSRMDVALERNWWLPIERLAIGGERAGSAEDKVEILRTRSPHSLLDQAMLMSRWTWYVALRNSFSVRFYTKLCIEHVKVVSQYLGFS